MAKRCKERGLESGREKGRERSTGRARERGRERGSDRSRERDTGTERALRSWKVEPWTFWVGELATPRLRARLWIPPTGHEA